MTRIALGILAVLCLIYCVSCGGSSSSNSNAVTVNIESTRFFPKNVTIKSGGNVTWLNTDSQPHQIVSGTLQPQGNPLIIHTITIGITGFTPNFLTANLGDTIRFNNLTGAMFTMSVEDDNGKVISTLVFNEGDLKTFTFPGAGEFTFRQSGSQINVGMIILFGQPTPDGLFQGPVLKNGGTFTHQFTQVGTFNYFDLNQTNPSQSFITGTVTVQ